MDRRQLIKAAAASVSAAYVWIPRLAIAQLRGDPRDAVIKTRRVLVSAWGEDTTSASVNKYAQSVKTVHRKMAQESYTKTNVVGTEFQRTKSEYRGAWASAFTESEQDYCHHYFPLGSTSEYTYLGTLPFIAHSFAIEDAMKSLSSDGVLDAIYPVTPVASFYRLDDDNPSPVRVIAKSNVWVFTQQVKSTRAGVARIKVTKRSSSTVVFDQIYEYNYA